MNRLVLGTAQIGMPYGIANKSGQPSEKEAFGIFDTALKNGVDRFDTAAAYGSSEDLIGRFLIKRKRQIKITTKLSALKGQVSRQQIFDQFEASLQRLRQKRIDCYMIHNVLDVFKDKQRIILRTLIELKRTKLIGQIGVSVYDRGQIDKLLKDFDFDVIQCPVSILDQRLLEDGSIDRLKRSGKKVYARSVFLQGLVTLDRHHLPKNLKKAGNYLDKLESLAKMLGVSKKELAFLYVYTLKNIDALVVGVDRLEHLKEQLAMIKMVPEFRSKIKYINFSAVKADDPKIVDPRQWR